MMNIYRKILCFLVLAALAMVTVETRAGTIGPLLQDRIAQAQPGDQVEVIVRFRNRVDVQRIKHKDRKVRRKRIIKALKQRTSLDEKLVKALLKGVKSKREHQLWLINGIATTIPVDVVEVIAVLPGVEEVILDRKITLQGASAPAGNAPAEWNINKIKAPTLWGLGYDGAGVVVATLDTGADPDHPDLAPRWRGGLNSWYDPYGQHPLTPHDASGHGTQVLGLLVGGNASGNQIGVAPGAQWIAVKIFDDAGMAQLSKIHLGYQWLLDPDGDPLTDDAPDIVNNSWELANTVGLCDTEFSADIANLKAAGIAVVFGSGNTGPNSGSSLSPPNDPQVLAVGAVDPNDTIASFSGRGPSACDGGLYPHLVAPGVLVNTADLTLGGLFPDSYTLVQGTSYAVPHISGGMALLKEAFPNATVTQLEDALTLTAVDLGTVGADNDYGNGLVDLAAAYDWLAMNVGTPLPGDFEFSLSGYSVAENGGVLTVTVNRVGGSAGTVTVDYATGDDTALAGQDYTPAAGTLTFADGETSQTFQVAIVDDTVYEGDETFSLSLSNPTGGAGFGAVSTASATIVENDPQPLPGTLFFAVTAVDVGEGSGSVTLTVNRSGGSDGVVTVDYATADGSATAGADYTATTGTLTLAAGQTSATITVPVLDDTVVEGDETFGLNLTNPTGGATLGTQTGATVTIVDDDQATGGDGDGDGFLPPADCNDQDPSVYPGAPEIKHDGIDQDCNGYDLTIDIPKAVYKVKDDKLTIRATSALAGQAGLSIDLKLADGRVVTEPMIWKAGKGRWEFKAEKFRRRYGSQPQSFVVSGFEGSESAPLKIK